MQYLAEATGSAINDVPIPKENNDQPNNGPSDNSDHEIVNAILDTAKNDPLRALEGYNGNDSTRTQKLLKLRTKTHFKG